MPRSRPHTLGKSNTSALWYVRRPTRPVKRVRCDYMYDSDGTSRRSSDPSDSTLTAELVERTWLALARVSPFGLALEGLVGLLVSRAGTVINTGQVVIVTVRAITSSKSDGAYGSQIDHILHI